MRPLLASFVILAVLGCGAGTADSSTYVSVSAIERALKKEGIELAPATPTYAGGGLHGIVVIEGGESERIEIAVYDSERSATEQADFIDRLIAMRRGHGAGGPVVIANVLVLAEPTSPAPILQTVRTTLDRLARRGHA
jgi:hypothetical protein